MYILSSARSTVLSEFPELNTKFDYPHAKNETNDFQFFAQKQLFLEVNKQSGLEFLRIKNEDEQKVGISQIRKMRIDNLYCVACPKQGHDEVALGYSNGHIKLLKYKNSEFSSKFSAETQRNSVIFLDYNASDEYLSSVYENGLVNIYGIKTKTKLETVNFDNNSTLARFHPVKRFHLSIASYKGSIYIYDIQSKRKIFQSLDCHAAPCRDLCMSLASPDMLLSVGYDCIIKIFDTRKKMKFQTIRHCHPLSTIALSECGTFFCVGDLKGEIISYDMRQLKTSLTSKKIHDGAVVRVAFVPNSSNETNSSFMSSASQACTESNADLRKSVVNFDNCNKVKRDSFCDFLDFQSNKTNGKLSSRLSTKRDSFDWDNLNRKNSDFNSDHLTSIAPKYSMESQSISYLATQSKNLELTEGKENNPNPNVLQGKIDSVTSSRPSTNPIEINLLKDRSNTDQTDRRLKDILEENELDIKRAENIVVCENESKQNILNLSAKDIENHFHKLPDDKNSTPNNCKRISKPYEENDNNLKDITKEIENLRSEMNSKFAQLENEIKFNAECNKWHIFTQNSNLWNKQMSICEYIKDGVDCLLQTNPFVNEYLKLKDENETLKQKILDLSKKK